MLNISSSYIHMSMRTDTKTKTPPNLLLNLQCWNFSPVSAGRWGVSGASKEQEKFCHSAQLNLFWHVSWKMLMFLNFFEAIGLTEWKSQILLILKSIDSLTILKLSWIISRQPSTYPRSLHNIILMLRILLIPCFKEPS